MLRVIAPVQRSVLALLLSLAATPTPAPDGSVGFDMRNVRLHVSDQAILDVAWLHARLHSTKPGQIPVFDDQQSFFLDVEDAEIAIDAVSLTALVNQVFDYKGTSLSNLRVSFENGMLVQRGTLKKGIAMPFTVSASVSVTPDGLMKIHPEKVKAAGIPATKLLELFGIELADIIKGRPDRGVVLRDNDMFLMPSKMVPPPEIRGRLTNAMIRGDRLVQVFGRGVASRPANARGNFVWFRGGTIRFGKLTMSDTDLELIDMDPKDPFDFFPSRYVQQLVGGYSKTTPQLGLRTYMPDYGKVKK
jgi:hypothetical protein